MMESEKSYTRMYIYHFESLASTLREYKTMRTSDFYGYSNRLLQPHVGVKTDMEEAK